MSDMIIVALISLVGTLAGPIIGILVSGKLTNYRIEQLETEVRKHNNVIERVYELEKRTEVHEEKLGENSGRIDRLEGRLNNE